MAVLRQQRAREPRTRSLFRRNPQTTPAPSPAARRPGFLPQFAAADLSDDDLRQLLSRALEDAEEDSSGGYSYCWIRDVFREQGYLTYEDWSDEATYRRTFEVSDDYSVTLGEPEEVIARTVYEPAPVKMHAFALPSQGVVGNDRFNVYPNSLLFEIRGRSETFPDKGITISEDDLADIAASFEGATMGLEHMDTVLGDNCGYVTDVRVVSNRKLYGTVAVPKGLDELIDGPRRVSVELEQDTDGCWCMPRVDLVLNPRIKRAALMGIQKFAGARHSTADQADIQAIHDLAAKQGAACGVTYRHNSHNPPEPNRRGNKEKIPMSFWDKLKAAFAEAGIEVDDDETPTGKPAGPSFTNPAAKAEYDRLKKFEDSVLGKKREEAKTAATRCFGQNAEKLKRAEATIAAISDPEALDDLTAQYNTLAPAELRPGAKPAGGNGTGRRITEAGEFSQGPEEVPSGQFDFKAGMVGAAKNIAARNGSTAGSK